MPTFRQPDLTTCGSAVAVRARMLTDPAYDAWLRGAPDPEARFADEALRAHRRTNRAVDGTGRLQLPWPTALGTAPWALTRELAGPHRVRWFPSPTGRASGWRAVVAAPGPVGLYVGNAWLPRHVVLVLRAEDDRLRVYEPGAGAEVAVTRDDFEAARLGLAGWDRPWCAVLPTGPA